MGKKGKSGKAIVLDPTSPFRRIVKVLEEGEYLGEIALVCEMMRSANVEAYTWTRLHMLMRNDFLNVRQSYPKDGDLITSEIKNYMSGQKYVVTSEQKTEMKKGLVNHSGQPEPDSALSLFGNFTRKLQAVQGLASGAAQAFEGAVHAVDDLSHSRSRQNSRRHSDTSVGGPNDRKNSRRGSGVSADRRPSRRLSYDNLAESVEGALSGKRRVRRSSLGASRALPADAQLRAQRNEARDEEDHGTFFGSGNEGTLPGTRGARANV